MSDVERAAQDLVASLTARPWGQVSSSVYETARLVTLAPWLAGHAERIAYLLATQRPDGGWGAPGGYGLVPTLSATEALLSAAGGSNPVAGSGVLAEAAGRGLRVLREWIGAGLALPDMPAMELIVPALVGLINERLSERPLPLPTGMDQTRLELVKVCLASGVEVPQKLMHALEVTGAVADGALAVRLTDIGTIGASPAATAAWLGRRGPLESDHPARRHLEAVAGEHGGPVPVGLPITVFERGWVLSLLARAGVRIDVPPAMLADLRAAIGPAGTPAGAGLPADADTTSVALYALALLGAPCEPESLWTFDSGEHFCTWQGEDGYSVSVNAHVLDAFGQYAAVRPEEAERYGPVMERLAGWLIRHQRPDGSWEDRWHASPYYATVSCALALSEFGGERGAAAAGAAVDWVLGSQRENGSWGRWEGTAEETAYALQTLVLAGSTGRMERRERREHGTAIDEGYRYLCQTSDMTEYVPLWHDKDLYSPVAVVRAAILAARRLAGRQVAGLTRNH